MHTYFRLTIRFLQPTFHGRGDEEVPEWPPSPLRAFQALVCAAGARCNERIRLESAAPALRWLERQPAPLVIAAEGRRARVKHRLYVPDNVGDKVAASWARGGNATLADYRSEKDVWPTRLPDELAAVHYLWTTSGNDPELARSKDALVAAAQGITHLGWGVDMVTAHASVITEAEAAKLAGERWRPTADYSETRLRAPSRGTLDALAAKHHAFLNRLGPEGLRPVPPLGDFEVVSYHRATDAPRRPFAAFSLLLPDGSGFRMFESARRTKAVAGMLRYAARHAARQAGWPSARVDSLILGHAERPGDPHKPVSGPRLAYLPLPSIQSRGSGRSEAVTEIRRAIVMQFGGASTDEFQVLTRSLGGAVLIPKPATPDRAGEESFSCEVEWDQPELRDPRKPIALLARIPNSDGTVRRYTREASTWATVTPLLLPGYDDPRHYRRRLAASHPSAKEQKRLLGKLDARIDGLIRAAIEHAGYSPELARDARIGWCAAGFWPGVELASRYEVPRKLKRFPRLHVRITWCDSTGNAIRLPGPICLGGGRYFGLGMFAAH